MAKVMSAEEILSTLTSQSETLEKLSIEMGSMEGRLSSIELKPEGDLAVKYKPSISTKTVVIALTATAAIAGAGYVGYRMLSKGPQELPEIPEALSLSGQRTIMSPNKVDAIRQSLAK